MSENSLRIRQKFINKMINKIAELDSDFELLSQVDRKLSRKNRKQLGGANVELKELQKQALVKRLQIEQQNADLAEAIKSATDLTKKVAEINEALVQIRNDISGINVSEVNLAGIDVPNVEAIKAKALEAIGSYKISAVKGDFAQFNEPVLGISNADMNTAKMTVDQFLSLFAEVINAAHKGCNTDVDKLKATLPMIKNATAWDGATTLGVTGVTERVYNKMLSKNPVADFASKYSW